MNSATNRNIAKVGLFERVGHFFKGPNPLHPAVWEGRLAPLTFRRFEIADLPQCLELYSLNEPGRFPEGVIVQYEQNLKGQKSYFLVAESEGQVVVSGGMHYFRDPRIAVFCYGLVRPGYQGRGLGTALMLARLGLLNPELPGVSVFIFALAQSIDFYGRFGFRDFQPWRDAHGKSHPSGRLSITGTEIKQCRELLANHGVIVPHDEHRIPVVKPDEIKALNDQPSSAPSADF